MHRRELFGAAAALALPGGLGWAAEGEPAAAGTLHEPARSVPIAGYSDVLVCGGGPAGVAAAISAARAGARVRLLELHGCLGGVWTSGMLSYVIDAGKPGFNNELLARLERLDAQRANARQSSLRNYLYDVEAMKFTLEDLCAALGIEVQLHTRVAGVAKEGRQVVGAFTESKSGRQAWTADAFIDATGDGDFAALAGCRWELGEARSSEALGEGCPCQPMSLMGVLSGEPETLASFNTSLGSDRKEALLAELKRAGITPSYTKPTLWHLGGPVAAVMLNHEYGVDPTDAAAVTAATFNARRELFQLANALRSLGGGWAETRLVTTAEQIGVRDGRRIRGRYEVDVKDVKSGVRHDDAVCRSGFCVDVHATTKEQGDKSAYGSAGVKAKPFDIPLRALVAADVDGLLTAGRCLSGDFFAHASYRVTGNAVATGEAAGVAAAVASKRSVMPHDVRWEDVAAPLAAVRDEAEALAAG
ncbi:FAD-dependent oxidoreductase [Alienimonas californiensis]|uniref:Ribulose-1,5-biphosphate synthetase n=1 Tax=Alienimonas californiensis TaxID=2527989 RepID=A0A517PFT4_9PLAN|nr:FAD-dependent oxidoreductase [Alienimonas californiensis]QDT18219.1 ribulose-1,5-biphosphate synthetase [Alienimonas californiensis]